MTPFLRIEAIPVVIYIIPTGDQIAIGTKIVGVFLIFGLGGSKIVRVPLIGKPPTMIVFFPGPV